MRVLVVEDNVELAHQLQAALAEALYAVDIAHDGREGQFLGESEEYDVVVLDLGLPYLDGLSVLTRWREAGRDMPVLILTSRNTWREKVTGLRAGADDYLAKPFEFEELMARVEALIRRSHGQAGAKLHCGDIELDTVTLHATFRGKPVPLTAYEYRTLEYLMRNPGKVISKTEMTEHIYDQDFDLNSNVIEVLINRLRNKFGADCIVTRRGLGYQLRRPDRG